MFIPARCKKILFLQVCAGASADQITPTETPTCHRTVNGFWAHGEPGVLPGRLGVILHGKLPGSIKSRGIRPYGLDPFLQVSLEFLAATSSRLSIIMDTKWHALQMATHKVSGTNLIRMTTARPAARPFHHSGGARWYPFQSSVPSLSCNRETPAAQAHSPVNS
jgi:hypothetical protein